MDGDDENRSTMPPDFVEEAMAQECEEDEIPTRIEMVVRPTPKG